VDLEERIIKIITVFQSKVKLYISLQSSVLYCFLQPTGLLLLFYKIYAYRIIINQMHPGTIFIVKNKLIKKYAIQIIFENGTYWSIYCLWNLNICAVKYVGYFVYLTLSEIHIFCVFDSESNTQNMCI